MSRRCYRICWLALAVGLISACIGGDSKLLPVPVPVDLGSMDPPVQQQYHGLKQELDRWLAEGSFVQQSAAFGELGLWYHVYELHRGAEAAYSNAHRLAPEDPRWPYYLGVLLADTQRIDEARAFFVRFLELQPEDVAGSVRLAELDLVRHRLESAESLLLSALSSDSDCVRALVGLGKVALARDAWEEAIEWLNRALAQQPDSGRIRYALGLAYRGAGQIEKAQALMVLAEERSRSVEILEMHDPLFLKLMAQEMGSNVHMRRAAQAERFGRWDLALQHFRLAAIADPRVPEPLLGVARSLASLGRTAEVQAELEQVLELFPDSHWAHYQLANHLIDVGDQEAAIEHLGSALQSHPSFVPALRILGQLLAADGDYAGALRPLSEARRRRPDDPGIRRAEALQLMRLDRYGEAARVLADGLRLKDRELTLLLARLLATAPDTATRDGQRAMRLARASFEEIPSLEAAVVVVMALAELGDFEGAVSGQRLLLDAVRRAGRQQLLPRFAQRLSLFEEGRPSRDPLPREASLDSVFVDPLPLERLLPSADIHRDEAPPP